MRLFDPSTSAELEIDLVHCERGSPCTATRKCRVHQLYEWLKQTGAIHPRTSIEPAPKNPVVWECTHCHRPGVGLFCPYCDASRFLRPIFRRSPTGTPLAVMWECTRCLRLGVGLFCAYCDASGRMGGPGSCTWCDEGNPRTRSSVSNYYVHTDTPLGRVLCGKPLPDLPAGFPRECEFGRID